MAWYNKLMRRSYKGIRKNTNKYDCLAHEHEVYRPLYRVWGTMIRRCTNPKCDMYPNYGGRGIKVCERWSNPETGFINFYRDMGPRPVDGKGRSFQIDRIDNDGGYCPENCRWVSPTDNARNKRNSHFVYINGEAVSALQAAELFGVRGRSVVENARRHGEDQDCSQALIRVLQFHGILTKQKGML